MYHLPLLGLPKLVGSLGPKSSFFWRQLKSWCWAAFLRPRNSQRRLASITLSPGLTTAQIRFPHYEESPATLPRASVIFAGTTTILPPQLVTV